jgi:hypothetical protein
MTAILPSTKPEKEELNACIIPPRPDSLRAHNAVNL